MKLCAKIKNSNFYGPPDQLPRPVAAARAAPGVSPLDVEASQGTDPMLTSTVHTRAHQSHGPTVPLPVAPAIKSPVVGPVTPKGAAKKTPKATSPSAGAMFFTFAFIPFVAALMGNASSSPTMITSGAGVLRVLTRNFKASSLYFSSLF
jgi:hypothetical protein